MILGREGGYETEGIPLSLVIIIFLGGGSSQVEASHNWAPEICKREEESGGLQGLPEESPPPLGNGGPSLTTQPSTHATELDVSFN